MRLAVVLDNKVNPWSLQRFEPLRGEVDVTAFVGQRNDYDTSSIDVRKVPLTHLGETLLALRTPVEAFRRNVLVPFKRVDYYYFSLREQLRGFDAVYSFDITRSAYTLACLKEELGFKLLLAWWENIPYRDVFDPKTSFHKKAVLPKVDLFLPFMNHGKEVLMLEGVPEEKIRVVHPGIDTVRFRPGPRPGNLMERYGIPPGTFVAGFVGKLVSWKGVHNLAYAAKILKDRQEGDITFVVVGKGGQRGNFEEVVRRAGLLDRFRFLDFIPYDEIPDVHRLFDVLILPSYPTMWWQEQFGMVLAEAMACGKPVISTQSGSIPEVVGDAGILIPPGDYRALADAIARLMRDPGLAAELGARGRSRVERIFDSRTISTQLRDALRAAAGGAAPGR